MPIVVLACHGRCHPCNVLTTGFVHGCVYHAGRCMSFTCTSAFQADILLVSFSTRFLPRKTSLAPSLNFLLSRSHAVLPSRSTSNLVNKSPACSAIHATRSAPHLCSPFHCSSIALSIVSDHSLHKLNRSLNHPVALRTSNKTDPLFIALSVLHDPIKLDALSSLLLWQPEKQPFYLPLRRPRTCSPNGFLGIVTLLSDASRQSSSRSIPLMQRLHQLRIGKCVISCSILSCSLG